MASGLKMFEGWAKRDILAFWVCGAIGIAVTDGVKEAIQSSLDFWPTFAIKVVAGVLAMFLAWIIWTKLIRPKTQKVD